MEFSVTVPQDVLLDDKKLENLVAQGVKYICAPISFIDSQPVGVIEQRAKVIKNFGIKVDTIHPHYGEYNMATSLVNQYKHERGRYIEQLKDTLLRMAALGVRAVPLHSGGCCLQNSPRWSFDLCLESIMELEPVASETNIILAMENTFYHLPQRWDGGAGVEAAKTSGVGYDDIAVLAELIDAAKSRFVQGCLDAGHSHYLGDIALDHQALQHRIALYHLHDNDGTQDFHMTPGYGTLNWDNLAPYIKQYAGNNPCFIEAEVWAGGNFKSLIRETAALLSGGRGGAIRRCVKCGHQILNDEAGEFCQCE